MVQHVIMSQLTFLHLNPDWNAEPNAPMLRVGVEGPTVTLSFYLNSYAYEATEGETGQLLFKGCSRWRWDFTNDEGWYSGEGRFSREAPKWGEFYEIIGHESPIDDLDWEVISEDYPGARHFLFYFRDDTIECVAEDWALLRELPASPGETHAR
jgi:hypothetical protein